MRYEITVHICGLCREAALRAASSAPLFSGSSSYTPREKYPNVYDQMEEARQSSAFVSGVKVFLNCENTQYIRTVKFIFNVLIDINILELVACYSIIINVLCLAGVGMMC